MRAAARSDGVLLGPEGAITIAALRELRAEGELADARVLAFNTGSLYKSPESLESAATG